MVLKNENLLKLITEIAIATNSNKLEVVHFKKNEHIVDENIFLKYLYVIKEGVCKCVINESENDKKFIIEFIGNGEIIGEIEAILGSKTMAQVVAITNLVAFKIELNTFKKLLNENKKFNDLILIELANKLKNTGVRTSIQQLNTIGSSLIKILKIQKEQHLIFSKNDLSEYLGITIRSLNRELKKLNINKKQYETKRNLKKFYSKIDHLYDGDKQKLFLSLYDLFFILNVYVKNIVFHPNITRKYYYEELICLLDWLFI
jgi:CRP-like cAMP-binding protein